MSAKTKSTKNMAALLDTRSQPMHVGIERFQMVTNASIRGRARRCRRGGWRKLYDGSLSVYNNHDLHDQLLGLVVYYEPLSETVVIPPGFTGLYEYQYWFSGIYTPATRVTTPGEDVCAYYPDFLPLGYDFPPNDGWGIINANIGYPYIKSVTVDDDPCSVTVNEWVNPPGWFLPTKYLLSNFSTVYVSVTPGVDIPGYGFGDLVPLYSSGSTYDREYCGTYPYTLPTCREAINWIGSVSSADGYRVLVAATKSRVYALNYSGGNWRILADGYGSDFEQGDCEACLPERWLGATSSNTLVLTNGVDVPISYTLGDDPQGCSQHRAIPIADLETLNVLSAGVVGAWKGFVLLGDIFMDGFRYRSRIIWSDYNNPTSFIPSDASLAGTQDLGLDDTILRIETLNDFLFIYTDRSIYRAALLNGADGTVTFAFEEIYRGSEGSLKYKFAFANTGEAHYYAGENRILKMTSFDKRPQEPQAIRLVSNSIFEGVSSRNSPQFSFSPINEEACYSFVGGYNPQFKEVWFSWPTGQSTCPTLSMVINVTPSEEGVDFVDYGFSAFHWFSSRSTRTLVDWFEDLQICAREDVIPELIKEGIPYPLASEPFTDPVVHIWNATEDPDLPPSEDSLCAKIADHWLDDVCDSCDSANRFVMASATLGDLSLKEYADSSYYREFLNPDTALYELAGYPTIIQTGPELFESDREKALHWITPIFTAEQQTIPNTLFLYTGAGPSEDCLRWKLAEYSLDCDTTLVGVPLACQDETTDEQHDEDVTRADLDPLIPVDRVGKFVSYLLRVEGTGGGACFSRVDMGVSLRG